MRVLILGGTGAMGALNTVLAEHSDEVFITSRRIYKSYGNVHYLQGNAHNNNFSRRS